MKKLAPLLALTASVSLIAPLVSAPAQAQPRLGAQSIIVNPTPTTLQARVWVNRDPSGQQVPNYRVGEAIRISASVSEDSYIYLFNVNPDGTTDQILPNRLSGSTLLRAGQTRVFPSARDHFTFDVAGPYGLNRVLLIASRRQLNLSELSTYTGGQTFATVKPRDTQGLAQALSITVNPVAQPIPQQDWNSDTASYNVAY